MSDRTIRTNSLVLFEVDGKAIKVKLRSINDSDEWLDAADEAQAMDAAIAAEKDPAVLRTLKREQAHKIYQCVIGYDPALSADTFAAVTPEQMIDAFYLLKEKTDPFEQKQLKQFSAMKEHMAGLPPKVVEAAMQKFISSAS